MQRDCAHEAQQRGRYPGAPTGFRRLTPALLAADHAAEDFKGLPKGVEHHGELLAAFKAAAPCLGLPTRLVFALDWLFRFTQAQDWARGRRPVVWPSASTQQEAFGLSENGVRNINRRLIDAGLVTMKDSPNGKRYGVRDRHGQIVEAYGFDLSPIATRHAEFVQLAAEAKAEREMISRLRRRATSPARRLPRSWRRSRSTVSATRSGRGCGSIARRWSRACVGLSGRRRLRSALAASNGGKLRRGCGWNSCSIR